MFKFWKEKLGWLVICRFMLRVFLITFPFQIQILIYKSDWFSGQFNSFSAVFLGFSEIVFWLVGLSLAFSWIGKENHSDLINDSKPKADWLILFLILTLLVDLTGVFFAKENVLVLLFCFKQLELFLILIIFQSKEVLSGREILKYLLFGGCIQALIAILQFVFQTSLGLKFLGETSLSSELLNVAKIDLAGGNKLVRAYGTFSHANILGGYMFINIVAFFVLVKKKVWQYLPLLFILLFGLLVSFSRTAWLATVVFVVLKAFFDGAKFNWKLFLSLTVFSICGIFLFNLHGPIWLRLTDFGGQAWTERMLFFDFAGKMILNNPFGVGIANFVSQMMQYLPNDNLSPWLFQPVHNLLILITVETGWIGGLIWLLIFICLGKKAFQSKDSLRLAMFFGIVILSLFDHYFWTNWAGQVVLMISFFVLNNDLSEQDLAIAH